MPSSRKKILNTTVMAALLLAVALATGASRAQEAAPWPPDPDAIFAEGVEVVSVELRDWDDIPVTDNDSRVVRLYDEASQQFIEFPYPANVQEVTGVQGRTDGTFFVYFTGNTTLPYPVLILDPGTGSFSLPDLVCDDQVRALQGEGEWRPYENSETGHVHLCFTETGELSEPLPDNVFWSTVADFGGIPSLSPDGKWLALIGYTPDASNPSHVFPVIYGYEIATGRLNLLGGIAERGYSEHTSFQEWVSNTQGTVYHGEASESSPNDYYMFDVTQPHSLELVVNGWLYDFYENPPRFEYVTTTAFFEWKTGSEWSQHVPCNFLLYDASGARNYELGYDCLIARIMRAGDRYFYVRADGNPSVASTLVSLDIATGQLIGLVAGEIEALESVSPNGRYAVLALDRNGQIDLVDYFFDYVAWEDRMPKAYLAVFDTASREFVYQTEEYNGGEISWLDNNAFLLSLDRVIRLPTDTQEGESIPASVRLVTLNEHRSVEVRIDNVGQYVPSVRQLADDRRYFLISRTDSWLIGLADFSSGTFIRLVDQRIHDQYTVTFDWAETGLLTATVRIRTAWPAHDPRSAIYTIRLPQSDSQ